MNKVLPTISILFFLISFAFGQNSKWVGIYTFDEESWDEKYMPTSTWFRLIVEEEKGKTHAILTCGENGQMFIKWKLRIKPQGEKASFYFEDSLTADFSRPISETLPIKGDLLFDLEKSTGKGKPTIYTIWKKLNLAAKTESGSQGKKQIFFRKA